jgi:hypothetical protein
MRTLLCGIITATLLLAGTASAQYLLTNGSFETPDVAGGIAQIFANGEVPGWTDTSPGDCGIEIQDHCCGTPIAGDQFVEVDSSCPAQVTQIVATQPGASYVLSFHYSPRPGLPFGDSDVDVSWNGNVVLTGDGSGITAVRESDRYGRRLHRQRARADALGAARGGAVAAGGPGSAAPTEIALAVEGPIEVDSRSTFGAEPRSQGPARVTDSVNPVRSGRKQR